MQDRRTLGVAITVAFLAQYVFNYLYQSNIMIWAYEDINQILRSKPEMKALYSYYILGSLIYVSAAGLIFSHGYKGKGLIEGFHFGLLFGFVLSGMYIGAYMAFPITQQVLCGWVAGSMLEGQIIGLSLAMVYNMYAKEKPARSPKKSRKKSA